MKKILFLILSVFLSIGLMAQTVSAKSEIQKEPYDTYIVGLDGNLVSSALAYEGVFVLNPGFNNPKDIHIDEHNQVFIADQGNKRIFQYDYETKKSKEIGLGILQSPTGVTTDSKGFLYVADYEAKEVIKFSAEGEVVQRFGRPKEYLFGEDSEYRPTKVAVDKRGNIFITSEGNANGIVQLNASGEFVGYFGPNKVNVTPQLLLKRLFLSKEDKETFASLKPRPTTNLFIDQRNIVYTVVDGTMTSPLKKYNVNGTNIISGESFVSDAFKDITVDKNGFIYTVDSNASGNIQVMDNSGKLLFMFGNTKSGSMILGHFDSASGISVDDKGNIWVLDDLGNNVQVFMRTQFASTVMNAMLSYDNGDYDLAEVYYQEIIRQNSSFVGAYVGLGQIEQRSQNYEAALEYFKIANYKSGYSEVYWEIRDNWLSANLLWITLAIITFIVLKMLKVHRKIYAGLPENVTDTIKRAKNAKITKELKHLPRILRKPLDVCYDIKYTHSVRWKTALGIFVAFVLINILSDYFIKGYLFKGNTANMNFSFELLKWGLIIILFVVGNYLVSTLQNGEGFFRDIFIGTMIAFAPLLLFKIPVDIITNILTYNESYLVDLAYTVLWGWSIFNVILMIKEVHNYKIGELIINLVLTAITMIVLVFIYLMIYILFNQAVQFIIGLLKEAMI